MSGAGSSRPQRDEYILARTVLLDALEALQSHLDAITLVGAQAIYLQIGDDDDKDALDLFRLLRAYTTSALVERFTLLRQEPASQSEADTARTYLSELFHDETAHGVQLVAQAVGALANRDEVIQSSVFLAQDFLDATKPI